MRGSHEDTPPHHDDPLDRGGAGLSHVGPLIEGFVGLGIGLGLLILTTRYIGTRS